MAIQVENMLVGMPLLRSQDEPIKLYYDETNNIRKLTLIELGLNIPDNKVFVIGGVALRPEHNITEWAQLRQALQIQENSGEIKFKHIARGNYLKILDSSKLATLLQWLLDQDIMIHYSAMDPLYWSILDIIESMMGDQRLMVAPFHMELKSELYHAIVQDLPAFLGIMNAFSYPNVFREQVSDFLHGVLDHVRAQMPRNRNMATLILKQVLQRATCLPKLELAFLHDNNSRVLIDNFSIHFIHSVILFKNATHVFDRETVIEKILKEIPLYDGERLLDYRFADSKSEIGIQLSDIVVGLMGHHFYHLQQYTLPQLLQQRVEFTKMQLANLHRLRTLIDKSEAFSEGLLHVLMPLDTIFKNNAFLHNIDAPSFMKD